MKVNIHDAKTHLSRYLELAERGEIVTICRNNVPIAELRALPSEPTKPRKIGRHKGSVTIHGDFFRPLDGSDLDAWEGRGG
jgi:antitoxin (DNA-binding transcriptional repressor) of toxin-antitoxin stability system